jgi:uncharacterized protein (TIGR00369 family)
MWAVTSDQSKEQNYVTAPYADSPGRWKTVLMHDGQAEMSWTPTPDMANPFGSVHGGIIATIVDEVTGAAVTSAIESATAPTVSLNVEYLHAIPIGGTYTVLGEIVRMGRAMAIVDARILNEEGKLLVRGTCIYQIPRPK